jgi:hypothetical protein
MEAPQANPKPADVVKEVLAMQPPPGDVMIEPEPAAAEKAPAEEEGMQVEEDMPLKRKRDVKIVVKDSNKAENEFIKVKEMKGMQSKLKKALETCFEGAVYPYGEASVAIKLFELATISAKRYVFDFNAILTGSNGVSFGEVRIILEILREDHDLNLFPKVVVEGAEGVEGEEGDEGEVKAKKQKAEFQFMTQSNGMATYNIVNKAIKEKLKSNRSLNDKYMYSVGQDMYYKLHDEKRKLLKDVEVLKKFPEMGIKFLGEISKTIVSLQDVKDIVKADATQMALVLKKDRKTNATPVSYTASLVRQGNNGRVFIQDLVKLKKTKAEIESEIEKYRVDPANPREVDEYRGRVWKQLKDEAEEIMESIKKVEEERLEESGTSDTRFKKMTRADKLRILQRIK